MDTKFNEIGTRTFHVKMVEFEGSVSNNIELTVGQYNPVILDSNRLHELIEVLQQAERLFGLQLKDKTAQTPTPHWIKQWTGSTPPQTMPFSAGSDGAGKGAQYGL